MAMTGSEMLGFQLAFWLGSGLYFALLYSLVYPRMRLTGEARRAAWLPLWHGLLGACASSVLFTAFYLGSEPTGEEALALATTYVFAAVLFAFQEVGTEVLRISLVEPLGWLGEMPEGGYLTYARRAGLGPGFDHELAAREWQAVAPGEAGAGPGKREYGGRGGPGLGDYGGGPGGA